MDMKAVMKITTMDRFMRYCIRDYEFMMREIFPCCSKAAGQPVEGMIIIMDFGGATNPISGELYDTSMKIMELEKAYFPKIIERFAELL